MGKINKKY